MKKTGLVFIILCMAVCFVPLAGMTVRPTTETTENRNLTTFPTVKTQEGKLNQKFFEQFETWFHEHFAFRNELVYADARIQGDLFGVSAEEWVIYGRDGWLYYTSSLKDYQGTERLSERERYALCHNLSLAVKYVEDRGIHVVLAIPPNKNTLYGEQMPYYDAMIADSTHEVDLLGEEARNAGIPYADLTVMFRGEDEILYLKRDSHWNNKGALMACNRILDILGAPHDSYGTVTPVLEKTENGDLNRMLYSFYGDTEENYRYDIPQAYQVTNGSQSVEDPKIETVCPSAGGSLVMFRDSFGNTLIPFVANQFGRALFTKESQYHLEKLIGDYVPEYVIMEKVERNLADYIRTPPVISAPERPLPFSVTEPEVQEAAEVSSGEESVATLDMETARFDIAYEQISGSIDRSLLNTETDIWVSINGTPYEAYLTGEDTYVLYLKKENLTAFPADVCLMTVEGDQAKVVLEKTIVSIDE